MLTETRCGTTLNDQRMQYSSAPWHGGAGSPGMLPTGVEWGMGQWRGPPGVAAPFPNVGITKHL